MGLWKNYNSSSLRIRALGWQNFSVSAPGFHSDSEFNLDLAGSAALSNFPRDKHADTRSVKQHQQHQDSSQTKYIWTLTS